MHVVIFGTKTGGRNAKNSKQNSSIAKKFLLLDELEKLVKKDVNGLRERIMTNMT